VRPERSSRPADSCPRRAGSDADGAIGEPSGERSAIGFGHGEHGLDAEFSAGTDDALRDLAAIRDQYAADGHG
jgi:hypothetical protein